MTDDPIETGNAQLVGVHGPNIVILNPKHRMTKDEALRHAAWLVALADESDGNADFKRVLEAVMNT
jgi:hypothetical protein